MKGKRCVLNGPVRGIKLLCKADMEFCRICVFKSKDKNDNEGVSLENGL